MNFRIIILLGLLSFCKIATAQTDTTSSSTYENVWNEKEDEVENLSTRWVVMELGTALYLKSGGLPKGEDPFRLKPGKSINWNFYLFQQRANIYKHKINLMYGMGVSLYSYHFKGSTRLVPDQVRLTIDNHAAKLRKNKFRTSYLNVPLLLNFRVKPAKMDHYIQISIGGYGEVLLAAATKTKGEEGKLVVRDDYSLNKFRYGLRTEIGIGGLHFYLSHSLISMFKEKEEPELYPINFGIKIIPF